MYVNKRIKMPSSISSKTDRPPAPFISNHTFFVINRESNPRPSVSTPQYTFRSEASCRSTEHPRLTWSSCADFV